MTRLRWPAQPNPRPHAAAQAATRLLEEDRRDHAKREATGSEDKRVLAALPGDAKGLAKASGLSIDRVGAALSRLKASGLIEKRDGLWRR